METAHLDLVMMGLLIVTVFIGYPIAFTRRRGALRYLAANGMLAA